MKKKIIIVICLLCSCIGIMNYLSDKVLLSEYSENLSYLGNNIYIKLYGVRESKAKKILDDIESLCIQYEQLLERYNHYEGVTNLYDIHYSKTKEEYITMDEKLYDIISYGITWSRKSNGLIDITLGNVTDVINSYKNTSIGNPSMEELQLAYINRIKNIELKDGNKIKNTHPNIDVSSYLRGYITERISEYLESQGIKKYVIDMNGCIKVGEHYSKHSYKIGLENPNNSNDIYKVLTGNNISVVTRMNDKTVINPSTLQPSTYNKSVTVIAMNAEEADILSTILLFMDVEEGKKYISNIDSIEVIWYTMDNEQITTDGFSLYELS